MLLRNAGEIGERINVNKRRVPELISEHALPAVRAGRSYQIYSDDLERWHRGYLSSMGATVGTRRKRRARR